MALAIIDFKTKKYEAFEITNYDEIEMNPKMYFDLASVTKPLTNSVTYLKYPELFDEKMKLLLNHRAGLPMGGRLSKDSWRDFLWQYEVKESETLYSDYSCLRTMLEIEKKSGKRLKELCSFYFDKELVYWLDKDPTLPSPITGWRNQKLISGEVHDDNCYYIHDFISHAGLFATVGGLSRSLVRLNGELNLLDQMREKFKTHPEEQRYIAGFDRPTDLSNTLAGVGCSRETFGHTGFTGTSFWIDINKNRGAILLTNATRSYWYERSGLTELRKTLGEAIWKY
jgi:CubicO group peptidase (beta-lactamase class C family)